MSKPMDPATEIAKEIAKQVPVKEVYTDAASPTFKQVGFVFEDLVKTIRLALFPLQLGAVAQDKFRDFIEKSKNKVPAHDLILPAPQILGPILEGMRYELENTEIENMFSELLACSMNGKKVSDVHPSFVAIIRQLTSDEAKILMELVDNEVGVIFAQEEDLGYHPQKMEVDYLDLAYSENTQFYLDRFFDLGLIAWFLPGEDEYFNIGHVKAYRKKLTLSRVGRKFMRACGKTKYGLGL